MRSRAISLGIIVFAGLCTTFRSRIAPQAALLVPFTPLLLLEGRWDSMQGGNYSTASTSVAYSIPLSQICSVSRVMDFLDYLVFFLNSGLQLSRSGNDSLRLFLKIAELGQHYPRVLRWWSNIAKCDSSPMDSFLHSLQ